MEKVGVYSVIKYFKENNNNFMQLKCSECGTIKIARKGKKRHFVKTKFCRSCPSEVRLKVYNETWKNKADKKDKERSLTKEELESRKKWSDVFNKMSGRTCST